MNLRDAHPRSTARFPELQARVNDSEPHRTFSNTLLATCRRRAASRVLGALTQSNTRTTASHDGRTPVTAAVGRGAARCAAGSVPHPRPLPHVHRCLRSRLRRPSSAEMSGGARRRIAWCCRNTERNSVARRWPIRTPAGWWVKSTGNNAALVGVGRRVRGYRESRASRSADQGAVLDLGRAPMARGWGEVPWSSWSSGLVADPMVGRPQPPTGPRAWDLRCDLRDNHPQWLPRGRSEYKP